MEEFMSEDKEKNFLMHIREIAKNAFWDKIYKELDENNFDSIISLVTDLSTRLTNLVPNNNKIQEEIRQEIDIDLIKQQLENGAFESDDFLRMFDCFCKWLLHLSSPAWDSSTKRFRNSIHEGVKEIGYVKMLKYAMDGLNDGIMITEYEVEEFYKKEKERQEENKI